jgi:hypothetical protein
MIACALVILRMIQIRVFHIKETPQFIDNLPSYRLYKRRIIQETPGLFFFLQKKLVQAMR